MPAKGTEKHTYLEYSTFWCCAQVKKIGGEKMEVNLSEYILNSNVPEEATLLGKCEFCGEEIYEGQSYAEWEGYLFCDIYCFAKWIGVKEVY